MLDLKETEAVELIAALAKRYRIAGRTTKSKCPILAHNCRRSDFCFGSWSCENVSAEGDRRRQAQLSMLSHLRAGIGVVCPGPP